MIMRGRKTAASVRRACRTAVLLVITTKLALADPVERDPVAARALFTAGKALLDVGDWKGACEKFEKSQAIDENVSTLIKIARCREHEGKLATASAEYERALSLNREKTNQSPERQGELDATIRRELVALQSRVPMLRIVVANPPSGLVIRRNDRLLPNVLLGERLPVDVGEHRIAVEAPGYRREERIVVVGEGKTEDVTLRLVPERSDPIAAPAASAPASSPATATVDRSARSAAAPIGRTPAASSNGAVDSSGPSGGSAQRIAGFATGGVGVAALGLAGYFGLRTLSLVDDSNQYCRHPGSTCDWKGIELRKSAGRAQTTGFVLAGVGAGLLVVGGALVLTAPTDPRSTALVVTVGPASVAGGVRW